jgi:hypothetical protein
VRALAKSIVFSLVPIFSPENNRFDFYFFNFFAISSSPFFTTSLTLSPFDTSSIIFRIVFTFLRNIDVLVRISVRIKLATATMAAPVITKFVHAIIIHEGGGRERIMILSYTLSLSLSLSLCLFQSRALELLSFCRFVSLFSPPWETHFF